MTMMLLMLSDSEDIDDKSRDDNFFGSLWGIVTRWKLVGVILFVFAVIGAAIRIRRATVVSSGSEVSSLFKEDRFRRQISSIKEEDTCLCCRVEKKGRWAFIHFWKKLPRRIWNFYISAFLIPGYRKEWGKYNAWNFRSPRRPKEACLVRLQIEMRSLERRQERKKLKRQLVPAATLHNHHDCQRVRINVGGCLYETQVRTLKRFPNTLLGDPRKRIKYFDPENNEYYFDRNRASFEVILHHYQSGMKLRKPDNISSDVVLDDARFFQLSPATIRQYQIDEGLAYASEAHDDVLPENLFLRKLWLLFDHPESSTQAAVVATISVSVIVCSITTFCLETLDDMAGRALYHIEDDGNVTMYEFNPVDVFDPFFFTECVCTAWFIMEYFARMVACPVKLKFFQSYLNTIDLIAILPTFFTIFTPQSPSGKILNAKTPADSLSVLRVIRLVRVFRIFKLSRYSKGLKILGQTLHASMNELLLLIFFVIIGVILFSSAVYFAEYGHPKSDFDSIPEGFWWAVVTISTVGFGDMVPETACGKIIGALCAVAGVLTIALPVPVIVSNFDFFYHQAVDEQDLSWMYINHTPSCPYRPMSVCPDQMKSKRRRLEHVPEVENSSDEEFQDVKRGPCGEPPVKSGFTRRTKSAPTMKN